MKKTALFLTLIFCICLNAQEVSPYYPAKNIVNDPYNFTSQMTYFDMNYISNNVSEFLTYRMNMVVEKDDDTKLSKDGGTYTLTYTDRISMSGNQRLIISYTSGLVNDVYTITSVKITGSKERLISFFVNFWQTSKNFNAPAGNSNVSLLTGQDVVKYYFNKGKPYITISNSTYKSIDEFKQFFSTLKS
ncbi:hypothetical protein [Flavobacterium covae]|uniref:hypothetical protein n=1 Tax=Flavobacterium covae TaxID=2906076 RepID=UPI000745D195|nr:hypothetical protein [Flavobacterium covae]AMA48973.1 hypothetical protein AWN65_05600 [Flavobacterium covae]MCJ1809892.1 hypothetical protein [Flavobacterium covae]